MIEWNTNLSAIPHALKGRKKQSVIDLVQLGKKQVSRKICFSKASTGML